MRTGRINKRLIIEKNEFIGINLGFDFVCEHEWGIDKTLNNFGATPIDNPYTVHSDFKGTKLYKSNENNSYIVFDKLKIKNKIWYYLIFSVGINSSNLELVKPRWNLLPFRDDLMSTAWSDGSFGIMMPAKDKKYLKEIYNAIENNDIVIGLGEVKSFANSGLKIYINSKLKYID